MFCASNASHENHDRIDAAGGGRADQQLLEIETVKVQDTCTENSTSPSHRRPPALEEVIKIREVPGRSIGHGDS